MKSYIKPTKQSIIYILLFYQKNDRPIGRLFQGLQPLVITEGPIGPSSKNSALHFIFIFIIKTTLLNHIIELIIHSPYKCSLTYLSVKI